MAKKQIILVAENILKEVKNKHFAYGIPFGKLIQGYFSYKSTYSTSNFQQFKLLIHTFIMLQECTNNIFIMQINDSLFPNWFLQKHVPIEFVTDYKYIGEFPFGFWEDSQLTVDEKQQKINTYINLVTK